MNFEAMDPTGDNPADRAAEQARIDALIARFFAAFDNRNGRVPLESAITALFAERAVIARHQDGGCELSSPREFAAPRVALLAGGALVDFCEWEETASTRIRGPLAVRSSRYAKAGYCDGKPFRGAGTKLFQLGRFESEWRIVALSWVDDA